jgi:hypothetical protein
LDPRVISQEFFDRIGYAWLIDVNVGDLMVSNREGFGVTRDEHLTEWTMANRKQAGVSEDSIDRDGTRDWYQSVFGDYDWDCPDILGRIDQESSAAVDLGDCLDIGCFEPLKVVV